MVVFGAVLAAALASMFFAYLRRQGRPLNTIGMALASQLSEARGDADLIREARKTAQGARLAALPRSKSSQSRMWL